MVADTGEFTPEMETVETSLVDNKKERKKLTCEITKAPRQVHSIMLGRSKNIKPEYSFNCQMPDDIQEVDNLLLTTEMQV